MTDLKDTLAALKPCPFCGAQLEPPSQAHYPKAALARLHPGSVDDGSCPIAGWGFYDEQLETWNTRSGQLVPVPSAEAAAEMVAQLRKLARKQEGYGMSFSDPSPRAGGTTSINLYGDRAKAAIWLFKNADRIADAVLAAMKGEGRGDESKP